MLTSFSGFPWLIAPSPHNKKATRGRSGFHLALAPRPHGRGCSGQLLLIKGSAVKKRGSGVVRTRADFSAMDFTAPHGTHAQGSTAPTGQEAQFLALAG